MTKITYKLNLSGSFAQYILDDISTTEWHNTETNEQYLKWLDGYEQQFNVEEQKMEWVKTSDGNTPEPADE